jgi:Uncharacterised protein conserved in bacteria (DUF2313)
MAGELPPFLDRAKKWLPATVYTNPSGVVWDLMSTEGVELDEARATSESLVEQFFGATATWTLEKWEDVLALPPPLPFQDDAERQSRIVSYLRGIGTANLYQITRIANAYQNGEVDVAEDFENARIVIYFKSIGGIPPNFNDLQHALREIVPAHITLVYEFRYFRWEQLDDHNWTWAQVDGDVAGGPPGAPVTWDEWDTLS